MTEIENHQKELIIIDLGKANLFGLLIIVPITLIFGLPYYLLWGNQFSVDKLKASLPDMFAHISINGTFLVFLVIIIGIVVHELIHGITWYFFTKNGLKSIKFGVLWKMLTPYCHCKEPLKVSQYVLGAIMPAILLGIIPAIISVVIGNIGLLAFGIFFTTAACGDFLIIHLLRNEKKDNWVLDHPSEAGCYIFRKIAE